VSLCDDVVLDADRHAAAEAHFLARVAAVNVRPEPYPRMTIADCLPDDYFAQLLALWPAPAAMLSLPLTGRTQAGRYEERFVAPLNEITYGEFDHDRRAFFSAFAAWLCGRRVIDAFLAQFEPYLALSLKGAGLPALAADAVLAEDRAGYSIPPHTDSPEKLFSILLYCQGPPGAAIGTSVYRALDPDLIGARGVHHPRDRFEEIERAAFAGNRLFAFLRPDNSFHGVEPLAARDAPRRSVIYTCYLGQLPTRFLR
jgi:hypothetical protein